jgi:hypothetical protein
MAIVSAVRVSYRKALRRVSSHTATKSSVSYRLRQDVRSALSILGGKVVASPLVLEPFADGETTAIHLTYRGGKTVKIWPRPQRQVR